MKVTVNIHDEEHRQLLKKYPKSDTLENLTKGDFYLGADFLVYFLFGEQSESRIGFKTFNDLKLKVDSRWGMFNDYIDRESEFLCAHQEADESAFPRSISEGVGIGVSLAVISKTHNLTHADWVKIPETNIVKTLDFQIASDGNQFLQVESKGTFKGVSKSNMVSSILEKKTAQRAEKNTSYLYGVVTSFYQDKATKPEATVLDPEPIKFEYEPYKFKVLTRLNYYLSLLRVISSSHLLTSLYARIKTIELVDNISIFSLKLLETMSGKEFTYPVSLKKKKKNYTVEGIENCTGDFLEIDGDFIFLGFDDRVINCLIQQDFDSIVNLSFEENIKSAEGEIKNKKDQVIKVAGELLYASSGLIIGRFYNFTDSNNKDHEGIAIDQSFTSYSKFSSILSSGVGQSMITDEDFEYQI
ncbi:hypothetical protein [Vibrio sp. L85]|uniref:hypothetical protein n=1 Tax=Vibrio sp. L85 TaxID=1769292 RepID=UPI0009A39DA9|nr:hypothetical protein [Vibrio sp. L85]